MRSGGRAQTSDGASLNERQALALELVAVIEETSVATQRRRAIEEYANRLLADGGIAEAVRLMVRARARNGVGPLTLVGESETYDVPSAKV